MQDNKSKAQPERSESMTVFAFLLGIQGIAFVGNSLFTLAKLLGTPPFEERVLAVIALALGCYSLSLAWGIYRLEHHACWSLIVFQIISVLFMALAIMQQRTDILSIAISLIVLVYLLASRQVRKALRA
jgi:predicted neutral ceramidase superfamily lipid hydrolase